MDLFFNTDLLLSGGEGRVELLLEFALVHRVVPRVLHEALLLPEHVVNLIVAQPPDRGNQ